MGSLPEMAVNYSKVPSLCREWKLIAVTLEQALPFHIINFTETTTVHSLESVLIMEASSSPILVMPGA